jgi:oxygen-dependent protoporphyrinogen oxidase
LLSVGAAGLAAAWYLREAGIEVTLIEKDTESGGRCRSHQWNGHWLIRGAAAFIGGENEPIELAKALNIYNK